MDASNIVSKMGYANELPHFLRQINMLFTNTAYLGSTVTYFPGISCCVETRNVALYLDLTKIILQSVITPPVQDVYMALTIITTASLLLGLVCSVNISHSDISSSTPVLCAFPEALVGGVADFDVTRTALRNVMLIKWCINEMFYCWKIISVVCIV